MSRENVDLDKQFQADMERAEALSLESLALEQFRNKKRMEETYRVVSNKDSKPKVATVSRAFSLTESDQEASKAVQGRVLKARPRPSMGGSGSGTRMQLLIAPPPTQGRRHSSTTPPFEGANYAVPANTTTSTTPDLISFTSPPVQNELIEYCEQLHNLQKQVATLSNFPPSHPPPLNYNLNTFTSGPNSWQQPSVVAPTNGNLQRPHLNLNMHAAVGMVAPGLSHMAHGMQPMMHQNTLQATMGINRNIPSPIMATPLHQLNPQISYSAATPPPIGFISAPVVGAGMCSGGGNMTPAYSMVLPKSMRSDNSSTNQLGLVTDGPPPVLPPKAQTSNLKLRPPPISPPSNSITNQNNNNNINRSKPASSASSGSTGNNDFTSGNHVKTHRRQTSNLIDLSQLSPPPPRGSDRDGCSNEQPNVKVSILEAFDPLLNFDESGIRTLSPDSAMHETGSVCDSVYDEYDPYDFIYTGSDSNSLSDPLYVAVVARGAERTPAASLSTSSPTPAAPPTLPPRSLSTQSEPREEKLLLYDCIVPIENVIATKNPELNSFHKMVQRLRNQFKYNDPDTNMGFVISPMLTHTYHEETSIKLAVYPQFEGADSTKPCNLTCDVTTSVEHITLQLTCDLEAPSTDQYTLKVWGCGEYLAPTSLLSDYEYVHTCIKLEQDVKLILLPDRLVDKSLQRTLQDDNRDKEITMQDIIPNEPNTPISFDNLKLLLDNLEKQISSFIFAAEEIEKSNNTSSMPAFQPIGLKQSVNYVIQLMGKLEIVEISEALQEFDHCCRTFLPHNADSRDPRSGKTFTDTVKWCCTKLRSAILELIRMYSQAFMVNFELQSTDDNLPQEVVRVTDINEYVVVRVCALYRPCADWKFDDYMVAAQVYHGMRPLGHPVVTQHSPVTSGTKILFNCWLDMQDIFVCSLARESRLVFVLYGRTLQPIDNKDDKDAAPYFKQEEIGWAAVQFFNYDGILGHGPLLLSLWPREADFRYGPAPGAGTHPASDHPILGVEIVAGGPGDIVFPPVAVEPAHMFPRGDFNTLDPQTREQLRQCVVGEGMTLVTKIPVEIREILWEKRHYLYDIPNALPRVLCCAHRWDWFCLADLHGMLKCWKPMEPVRALELLLPTFPDTEVRKLAVNWIKSVDSDELVDYLPQLVVAYTQETYHESFLAKFLLQRAMARPRVAHYLFWLLCHNLPGYMPQNSESFDVKPSEVAEFRHHRRMLLLLRALLAMCGEALRTCLISQQFLSKRLHEIAVDVQETRDSQRLRRLQVRLDEVHSSLAQTPTALPLAPTLRVSGVHVPACSYFATNTLPLKVTFMTSDDGLIPAIFKVGDDLQQDQLTLQIIRIMNKLWLKEGLDLKMVTFACIPTGKKRGIIEMVQKSETLRKIQVELGLTGSFKDKSIHEWLAKHNPSELEYTRAVENFTASCAGYCVVTYILGICDRHNDNIMLKTSGHMFHIDFGKFLGDAQMFGNFKRDRTPFVLTSDMAYVINGGDRPTEKFQKFVDLCCQAFNIVRNNGNLFLYLVTFMAASGSIKGLTTEAVAYLHKALMPDKSNADAAACFTRLIESSLNSISTQVNFFIHNIAAQLKFSSDSGGDGGELLSFIPNKYSMETDGKLTEVQVVGYRKCYDPDKYYVYILQILRVNVTEHARVLRTYKEFCELHQKLCMSFPLAKLYSLSTGLQMGRSNIKQVAEKRLRDISLFLRSLFRTADEIAHSDLVYTFFHPLLRDQQLLEHLSTKKKDRVLSEERRADIGKLSGQLRLSLLYSKGVFGVMVQHARGLPPLAAGQPPSAYVKVYLTPDPGKTTKRKTKVVRRNFHPSFMEMLEYRMPLELILQRNLKATVWNSDPLQENEFLGGVELPLAELDLTKEITEWYSLGNVTR